MGEPARHLFAVPEVAIEWSEPKVCPDHSRQQVRHLRMFQIHNAGLPDDGWVLACTCCSEEHDHD
jgi:hypothetical protein